MSISEIHYNLFNHDQCGSIYKAYLGCYSDPQFIDQIETLKRDIETSTKAQGAIPEEAFLVGEWGLTGICMAYALECVGWVEKHANRSDIPPLMQGRPNESIRHMEKLLVLAIYQSIGKKIDPKNLSRREENRAVINRVSENYARLQQERTGVNMVQHFPGPSFFESTDMLSLIDQLEALSKRERLTEKDHFIFTMSLPGFPIPEWHVIYINPTLGVIADARSGLLWKIDEGSKKFFYDTFRYFVEDQNYAGHETVMTRLAKGPLPKCRLPLLVSRVLRRSQTSFSIARHSGVKQGVKYLHVIHKYNWVVQKFFPCHDTVETYNNLVELLKKSGIGKELVQFVRNNLRAISKIDFLDYNLHEKQAWWLTLYMDTIAKRMLSDGEKNQLLETLSAIQKLGAPAHSFACLLEIATKPDSRIANELLSRALART